MNKPTLKEIKLLKGLFLRSILGRMNSEVGCDFVAWREKDRELFVISSQDDYGWERVNVPAWYKAGIDDGVTCLAMTRADLASEEAKRRIRDLFPGYEKFVTWAYYK